VIEETARVVAQEGAFARVETERTSTCGSCAARSACGTSAIAKAFGARRTSFKVLNPVGARIGEQVVIGLEESALTRSSFVFYIVPLLALFLFAALGQEVAARLNLNLTEPASIVGGLLGLLIGLGWVRRYASRVSNDKRRQAVILRRDDRTMPHIEVNARSLENPYR